MIDFTYNVESAERQAIDSSFKSYSLYPVCTMLLLSQLYYNYYLDVLYLIGIAADHWTLSS